MSGNGTLTINSSIVHHGVYSSKSSWSAGGDLAYATKTFANTSVLYVREYVLLQDLPQTGTLTRFLAIRAGTTEMGMIGLERSSAGVLRWTIRYRNNGILTTTSTASLPSAGQWFCVEYKIQCSSADGQPDGSYILYVNGTQIWSVSNVDTDNIYVNRVDVGLTSTSDSRALALYIDCVVVADTYIGPEIVKTWSATLKVSHVSTRPFRVMKLCQNINATHIFQRPARFMRLSQALQTLHAWTVIYPGLILKKWFATLQTTHTFKRPIRQIRFTQTLQTIHVYTLKRLFRLEENLNLTHVLRRPYRRLGYMQQLQPTHILRRPIRLMKLPAALQLTHVFSRPYRVIRLLQQLGLIHVYYVAVPGVKKTKLFLVIGDLAIQLSGD